MRVLVVGASGLLGRSLVEQLSREHEVYALMKECSSMTFESPVRLIYCDLCALALPKLPREIDAVYYLAQSRRYREFPDGAEDMVDVNVRAVLSLAEWARQEGVRSFVYASTGGVYGSGPLAFSESSPLLLSSTRGFYANTKLSCELLLESYSKFFEKFVILRPFFIYGPRQEEIMLIPRLFRYVNEGKQITLSGKQGIKINPIYVDDAATSCIKILNLDHGSYVFNLAGDEIVTIRGLGDLIGHIIDKASLFSVDESDAQNLVGDISLMKQRLHVPKIGLAEGLRKMIGENE